MAGDLVYPLALEGAAFLSVDLVSAIFASDALGLGCLLLLSLISMGAVALIVRKWRELNRVTLQNRGFRRACERDGRLDAAYLEADQYKFSTLGRLFHSAYFEAFDQNWFREFPNLSLDQRLAIGKQALDRALERSITDEVNRLEGSMIGLGTVATVCPFIGLFGTVWGVLAAFQGLAAGGAADITMLAPGISTALTTTIAGLFPAILAVIAYNHFQSRIQNIAAEMDAYALDLHAIFARQIIRLNTDMRAAA